MRIAVLPERWYRAASLKAECWVSFFNPTYGNFDRTGDFEGNPRHLGNQASYG